jgi:hypothetical protein
MSFGGMFTLMPLTYVDQVRPLDIFRALLLCVRAVLVTYKACFSLPLTNTRPINKYSCPGVI